MLSDHFLRMVSMSQTRPRSSRRRYLKFVEDYKAKRLDALLDQQSRPLVGAPGADGEPPGADGLRDGAAARTARDARRRRYLREYFHWLKPHRYAVIAFILLALLRAGL